MTDISLPIPNMDLLMTTFNTLWDLCPEVEEDEQPEAGTNKEANTKDFFSALDKLDAEAIKKLFCPSSMHPGKYTSKLVCRNIEILALGSNDDKAKIVPRTFTQKDKTHEITVTRQHHCFKMIYKPRTDLEGYLSQMRNIHTRRSRGDSLDLLKIPTTRSRGESTDSKESKKSESPKG